MENRERGSNVISPIMLMHSGKISRWEGDGKSRCLKNGVGEEYQVEGKLMHPWVELSCPKEHT